MVSKAHESHHAREWIDELDLLRAFALLAVVLIHCGSWIVGGGSPPLTGQIQALVAVARFCVPAFVLMSGLVLYRTYGGRPRQPGAFLRKRWLRVLVPWAVWAPVFFLVGAGFGKTPSDPLGILKWAALGPGHLYFLLLIAQLYLVMLLIPRGRAGLAAFTVAALALQLILGWLHTYLLALTFHGHLAWPLVYEADLEAPFWIGYFSLGCLIGSEYERLRHLSRYWWLALLAAAVAIAAMLEVSNLVPHRGFSQSTYAYLWPSMLPMTVAIVASVLWAGRRLRPKLGLVWPAIRGLSRHSLGIYVLHVLVVTYLGLMTPNLFAPLRYALLVVVSLAVTYPVVAWLASTRPGAIAVGEAAPARVTVPRRRAIGD
ncbi:MAG: acyltransferase [Candidatus Dormibacteraceae bacterium]